MEGPDRDFQPGRDAVKRVVDSFQWMWDKIVEVGQALKEMKLPDWLTPGSPTPLELGLIGINRAMDELAGKPLQYPAAAGGDEHAAAGACDDAAVRLAEGLGRRW